MLNNPNDSDRLEHEEQPQDASRLDEETPLARKRREDEEKSLAKKLHNISFTYALYGLLDGLSTSYSTIKYAFDLIYTDSSTPANEPMHNWMLTPEGIALVALESVFIIATSMIANTCKKNKNAAIEFITAYQPYVRDTIQGAKNTFKGIRSLLQAATLLSGEDLRYYMAPVGLILGLLSVANRIWNRRMTKERTAWKDANATLLEKIQNTNPDLVTKTLGADLVEFLKQLDAPSRSKAAYLSAGYSGFIDGLYLFMGCATLATFCPPVLITVIVFSATFALLTVVNRMYEEQALQAEFEATQTRVKLALCGKELEGLLTHLLMLSEESVHNDSRELIAQQELVSTKINERCAKFVVLHNALKKQVILTSKTSLLEGLGNGLYAYNALTSILFGIATILAITSTMVSPWLVLSFAIAGMLCVIGFMVYARCKHNSHQKNENPEITEANNNLWDLIRKIKEYKKTVQQLNSKEQQDDSAEEQDKKRIKNHDIKVAIMGGMSVDASPQSSAQDWFEIIRSFFSGISKAQKSVDYTLNPLQEFREDGKLHETPVMLWIIMAVSVVYSFGFALRAYAKGFNKEKTNIDNIPKLPPPPEPDPRDPQSPRAGNLRRLDSMERGLMKTESRESPFANGLDSVGNSETATEIKQPIPNTASPNSSAGNRHAFFNTNDNPPPIKNLPARSLAEI